MEAVDCRIIRRKIRTIRNAKQGHSAAPISTLKRSSEVYLRDLLIIRAISCL
jgi:hypothetical protein